MGRIALFAQASGLVSIIAGPDLLGDGWHLVPLDWRQQSAGIFLTDRTNAIDGTSGQIIGVPRMLANGRNIHPNEVPSGDPGFHHFANEHLMSTQFNFGPSFKLTFSGFAHIAFLVFGV